MNAGGLVVSHVCAVWAGAMERACWEGGLFVLAVWAICRLLPRLPVRARYALWWLACLKLAVSAFWPAPVALPWLPPAPPAAAQAPAPPAAVFAAPLTSPGPGDISAVLPPTSSTPAPAAPTPPAPSRHPVSLLVLLLLAWLTGAAGILIWSVRDCFAVRRLLAQTRPEPPGLEDEVVCLSGRLGLRRAPRVLIVNAPLASPLVWATPQPLIVLPDTFVRTVSSEELRMALAHELAHVRRGDLWLGLLPALTQALFFFFPLARLACRECGAAREEACDALALQATGAAPARYGQLLLKVISGTTQAPPSAALGIAPGYGELRRRLLTLASRPGGRGLGWAAALLTVAGLLFLVPWRLVAASSAAGHTPAGEAPLRRYVLTDLGTVGGEETEATGINNRGQVVGSAGIGRAFLWQRGALRLLRPLPRYRYSLAWGINNRGQVVASSYNIPEYDHALLWQGRRRRAVGALPGYTYSQALGINDGGQVVGDVQTGEYDSEGELIARAFLWNGGRQHDLGTLGGDYSFAYAINDRGQVVGKSDLAGFGSTHAFLWQNGRMRDLGTLGGANSLACAINNAGQAAGFSQTAGGALHACFWQNGTGRDLGTLPGGNHSEVRSLNSQGAMVGFSDNDPLGASTHAILWDHSRLIDLNRALPADSSWTLEEARAINDRGQIVGRGRIGGRAHAFLLTPAGIS